MSNTPGLNEVNTLIGTITDYVRMIGYAAAVAVIIWAGIAYFTAYGNEEKPKQAKNAITGAIIGIVLIVLAQTIVLAILGQIKSDEASPTPVMSEPAKDLVLAKYTHE